MAYSGTVTWTHQGTLVAGSVDTVTFTAGHYGLALFNKSAGDVYFNTNVQGTAAPVLATNETYCVRAASLSPVVLQFRDQVTVVRVIAAGANEYGVEGR